MMGGEGEMETIVSHTTENIWKVKRGSGGASPPEANGMKRSQIKWKLLLFDDGGREKWKQLSAI